ncbi:MAG TPA: protease HtpX [Elusimicrobiota bacterium]|nr:protease HtpX [Elusimicrobiota bacterium]HNI56200.1 protease HtpX [Elusimicrobiota bacterium]
MAFMRRIVLFMAVNLLVVTTISIVLQLLGVHGYMTARGLDYQALMVFCLVWGLFGALTSLALSRIMAKWMMGVRVIDPAQATGDAAWLVQTVHALARAADLPEMPEVGIYASPELNAFATGPTKSRALVAVSAGLLESMDRRQVEGVLGHEITHISNGDMVTMTLIQGVVNAFVMFFSRVIGFLVSQQVKEEARRSIQFLVTIVSQILFSLLGMIVVASFSRWREYRADAGGARLAGREKMIAALEALGASRAPVDTRQASVAALKISGRRGFLALLSTHPPLEDRIARLNRADY